MYFVETLLADKLPEAIVQLGIGLSANVNVVADLTGLGTGHSPNASVVVSHNGVHMLTWVMFDFDFPKCGVAPE